VIASRHHARAARLVGAALALAAALAASPRADALPPAGGVPLPPPPSGTRRVRSDVPLQPPPPSASLPSREGWLAIAAGPYEAFERGSSAAIVLDYGFAAASPRFPRVELEWHLVVIGTRPADDSTINGTVLTSPYTPPAAAAVGIAEERAWVIEAVPSARLRLPLAPGFALFAEGGVGLCQTYERRVEDQVFVGRTVKTKLVTGGVLRLGAGMSYDLGDSVRVVFHPLALSIELGPAWSGFAPTLGLAFRL
jgi:hypothetical protein